MTRPMPEEAQATSSAANQEAIDQAVMAELTTLYEKQSQRTGPVLGLVALLIGVAAWPRAPHWAVITWVLAEWLTLFIRRQGLKSLHRLSPDPRQRLRIAQALRGLHAMTNAASVLFFPFLSELGRTMVTLILAGLTTGAIGTSGGYLPVYLVYAVPVMGALMLGWALTPLHGEDQWLGQAMAPLILLFALIMVGLARDSFRTFRTSIAKRLDETQLNQQLRAALDQAEAANAAKTRFLASASHDLRQPLHSLSLFFATLRLQVSSADHVTLLGHIDQALHALQTQMNTLLDMSKLDAGMVHVDWQNIPLKPALEPLITAYLPIAHQKGVRLALHCPSDLVVSSDGQQLSRVLRNLLDNALKYTNHGHVLVDAQQQGDHIAVRVQDTGCGIAPNHHRQVFEEFFQVDNPERDRGRGLGLGLSIIRRLAPLLHIEIELQSTPDVGTTMTLRIPCGHGVGAARATPVLEDPPSMPMCHVLVLDDEAAVRAGMEALLKRMRCEVSLASCIDEAVALASLRPPDLLLADLRLRGRESGIQAVELLRRSHPNLPAIIITGDTAPNRLKQAESAGLPVLHKPVAAATLVAAIAACLESATPDAPSTLG